MALRKFAQRWGFLQKNSDQNEQEEDPLWTVSFRAKSPAIGRMEHMRM